MRFRPFKIRYEAEDEKTVVYMHGRDEKGRHRTVKVDGTEPHFFVKAGQGSKLLKQEEERAEELESPCRIVRVEKQAGQCFITEKKLDKVVARFPFDVSKLRELVDKTWEADVVYENRVRYDLGIMADVEVPENCERVHKSKVKVIRPPRPGKGGVRRGGPYDRIGPRWAVYDIEVYDKGGFHGPEDARAPVVSVAAWDSFSERYVCVVNAVLRSVHKTNLTRKFKKEGWKVQTVEVSTEEDLFSTFNKWIKNVKPDMLIGWNSSEYDDDYLKKRSMRIGCERPAFTELVLFDAEDGYIFSKYQRPESSSLHYVATQEFGLEGKSTDMRIWEMMDGPRDELVFYNVSDVFLTKEIVEQSGMLDFYLRLAERAGVNIGRCFSTGHLVDSMVFHRLSGTNRIQPTKPYISKKEKENWGKISGAEVFDPSTGLYDNVVELDNKSEYPMIIRTFNISPETIIEPEDWERFDSQSDQWIETPRKNRYRIDVQGIFPELLEELQGDRDAAKAVGDSIGDDVNKKLMNTFYGVMPSPTYRMPDKRIGGDITGLSRAHLAWNKKFVESWEHPNKVLYGDSVTGNMPVIVRDKKSKSVDVREIQDIEADWGKLEVLSDRGFTNIVRFIKKPKKKKLFSVRTMEGLVFVTEDHSLVDENGREVKPVGSEGKKMLTKDLSSIVVQESDESLNYEKAWFLGAFAADGNCNVYDDKYKQVGFSVNKNDVEFLQRCQDILEDEWNLQSRIKDIRKSTGCQRLYLNGTKRTHGVGTDVIVRQFRSMCYTASGQKKVPSEVINSSEEVWCGFLDGYYDGDGDKTYAGTKPHSRSESKSFVLHQGIALLHNLRGDTHTVRYRANKKDDGRVLYYSNLAHKYRSISGRDRNIVKEVKEIEMDCEWVYDLETESHHFACGIGNLVVHNTDSNHVYFQDDPDRDEVMARAKKLAADMNNSFKKFVSQFGPVKNVCLHVKPEKDVYDKFLQAGKKKKYACLYRDESGDIERDGIKYNIKWRGFEIRRGDAARATKEAQTEVLTEMLFGADRSQIISMVNDEIVRWRRAPAQDWESLWKLGKPSIVKKSKHILKAVRYSNTYLGCEFRQGDKEALFNGYVRGYPKVKTFMWYWMRTLHEDAVLDMETTIDKIILTPLEGPLDLLDLRPSDCKNPVEAVDDWI